MKEREVKAERWGAGWYGAQKEEMCWMVPFRYKYKDAGIMHPLPPPPSGGVILVHRRLF